VLHQLLVRRGEALLALDVAFQDVEVAALTHGERELVAREACVQWRRIVQERATDAREDRLDASRDLPKLLRARPHKLRLLNDHN
jgi:hypothetical protein